MDNLLITRENEILTARRNHLELNALAADGGEEYVNRRLWRGINESEISWSGEVSGDRVIPGRKKKTFNLNDAGRISGKIEQYIFSEQIVRNGANPDFIENVSGTREGIDAFMLAVCHQITLCGWCWLQVDAPRRDDTPRSVKDRIDSGYRVRWRLWPAVSVVDWDIKDDGSIRWLITESTVRISADPRKEARKIDIRTLYELGEDGFVHITEIPKKDDDDVSDLDLQEDYVIRGLDRIPFVLVGRPSIRPWWFDMVEQAQCQTMNLTSLHHDTLFVSVFPQMIVSDIAVQNLETSIREEHTKINGEDIVRVIQELIRGRRNPILESSEDKGLTRFIEPGLESSKIMTDEIERIRKAVFDTVGLALFNRETRQIQSADSKKFDHLDTNSTLRHRALMLQRAERDLVEISQKFDGAFSGWDPVYPSDFNVVDTEEASKALVMISNMMDATPEMKRMSLRAAVEVLKEICNFTDEQVEKAMKEIDEKDFDNPPPVMIPNVPPKKKDGGDDEDDEDEDDTDGGDD